MYIIIGKNVIMSESFAGDIDDIDLDWEKYSVLVFTNFKDSYKDLVYKEDIEPRIYKEDFSLDEFKSMINASMTYPYPHYFGGCSEFNSDLDDMPESILELYLGYSFNKKVTNLTNLLTKLIFNSYCFDRKINFLTNSINVLRIAPPYNRKTNDLPNNINSLSYGEKYHQKINRLPQNISYLFTGIGFQ
jgi:hypothetical protein